MDISKNDFQLLLDSLIVEMVRMLMSEYHYTLEESMNMVYTSETLGKIERPETGLYYQSAVYVMHWLAEELGLPPLSSVTSQKPEFWAECEPGRCGAGD